MKWRKGGLVWAPTGDLWWAKRYATLPTADLVGDRIRVYWASLDENNHGRVGYVEVDASNPARILDVTREPILDIGGPGTFDDSGVNPSCVLTLGERKYLYYVGWQRTERVPYLLYCGVALGDGIHFEKPSRVPVLERTSDEPYLRSAVSVLTEGSTFRMWYVSGLGWTRVRGRLYPAYVVRYAESPDAIHWSGTGHVCIPLLSEDEFGIGRPWVLKDGGLYKMWYSIRSRRSPYRMGYAESSNGLDWTRKDGEVGIEASQAGWDSEMICYPCVVDAMGKRYMFYNGNQHGKTGFGYAELES